MIYYKCTNCGLMMESPPELAGERESCPDCGTIVPVPPRRIGGWLILVAISLIGRFVAMAILLLLGISWYRHPWFAPACGLCLVYVAFLGYVVALFFQKRRILPPFIIALFCVEVLWVLGLQKALFGLEPTSGEIRGAVVHGVIWTAYFVRSERVKQTFLVAGWPLMGTGQARCVGHEDD